MHYIWKDNTNPPEISIYIEWIDLSAVKVEIYDDRVEHPSAKSQAKL